MRKHFFSILLSFVLIATFLPVFSFAGTSDANNGDWSEKTVTLTDTDEAQLMVRVGDIDNVGYGFQKGYDPFTAERTKSHGFPWDPDPSDPDGTDRIMMGTAFKGSTSDGYSKRWNKDQEGTTTRPIKMTYDTSGIDVKNVLLQMYIDDFQAPVFGSNFTVKINGKDAPFIAEVLNHVQQTGPIAYIISAEIPQSFFKDISSGSLSILINETTGVGDGFAVDFVKLLVNYNRSKYIGTISGVVKDKGTNAPLSGANVRVLGTRNTVVTGANGNFTAEVIAGLNVVRASKQGYIENYQYGVVPSGGKLDFATNGGYLYLAKGKGNADINYYSFAGGEAWSDASAWATKELQKADEYGLIPDSLKGADMTKPITREEFAELAVKLYEKTTGKAATAVSPNPFTDTKNPEILKAFQLGITDGTSPKTFSPDSLINREQVAAMLSRALKAMVPDGDFSTSGAPTFSDQSKVSSWASESVKLMSKLGVMSGSNGKFMPKATTSAEVASGYGNTTREQAVAMSVRTFEKYKN
ncbi:MAG TPA: S-layer homology domain-containing protein [Ruminiclostridium sp.]|nr:S-layer homology domain-containing protein [Ruminiclostridium sp.]